MSRLRFKENCNQPEITTGRSLSASTDESFCANERTCVMKSSIQEIVEEYSQENLTKKLGIRRVIPECVEIWGDLLERAKNDDTFFKGITDDET